MVDEVPSQGDGPPFIPLLDTVPDAMVIVDRAGEIVLANYQAETLFGYRREELTGMPVDRLVPERLTHAHARYREHFFKNPSIRPMGEHRELRARRRDGSEFPVEISLSPVETSQGLQVSASIRDITDHRRSEVMDITAIRQTESELEYVSGLQRVLVEASKRFIAPGAGQLHDLITEVLGHVGEYCEVDRSYLFRFKHDREQMDNTHEWCAPGINPEIHNLQDLPRDEVPMVAKLMERGKVAHIPRVAELEPEWSRDREVFEDEDIQSLILVPILIGEDPYGFIGFDSVRRERVWSDEEIWLLEVLADLIGTIVDRESSAQALRDAEARYRSVVEHIREVVFQADRQGRWTFLNPAWEEITGFTIDESLGRPFQDFVYPDDRPGSEREFAALMRGDKRVSRSELRYRSRLGSFRWLEVNLRTTADEDGHITGCAGTMRDVTEQREAERKMLQLAHYDPVTDLPNRILALDRLDQLLKRSQRSGELVAVLFVDLDHFKKANDTLGHEAGDELLREASLRFLNNTRDQDTVARFGGDEFLILLGGLNDAMDAQPVAEKLLQSFRRSFQLRDREFLLTASVGIAISPTDGTTPQDLLRNADMAMYESKAEGRNTYHYFTDAMNRDVERRLSVEEQLRGAVERNELSLVFQTIVDLSAGTAVGAEALARWYNPQLGEVSPEEFIPIAEQAGLIDIVGNYVLEQALKQVAHWRCEQPDFRVSVNVSPQQFRTPDLVARIANLLRRHSLPGEALQVEITESVLLDGHPRTSDALGELKRLGVSIAMDDFGTGYASLSYLRQFPFDTLKIDRSFINDITEDPRDYELVVASLALAHGLGLTAAAEGVETREQLVMLRKHGCHLAQGFLFGFPPDAEAFTRSMASENRNYFTEIFSS